MWEGGGVEIYNIPDKFTCMKTKDGGATPKKDPTQNGTRGTPKHIEF